MRLCAGHCLRAESLHPTVDAHVHLHSLIEVIAPSCRCAMTNALFLEIVPLSRPVLQDHDRHRYFDLAFEDQRICIWVEPTVARRAGVSGA